jgi:hypothetical protein
LLGPREVLRETEWLIENLTDSSQLTSDHYTNYINLNVNLPDTKQSLLRQLEIALRRREETFRSLAMEINRSACRFRLSGFRFLYRKMI